nr:hypothetical protein [candidate division Zixibacteria bacterium]
MRKLTFVLLIAIAIMAGCADDVIIPPQSELRGAYTGVYKVVTDYKDPSSATTDRQNVDWTFTDQKFFCTVTDDDNVWLCDYSGYYEVTDALILSDTLVGVQTCDKDKLLVGRTQLIRYQGSEDQLDSVVITQEDSTNVMFKTLVLIPEPE